MLGGLSEKGLFCSASWKNSQLKAVNMNALGLPVEGGHLHPLLKVCFPVADCSAAPRPLLTDLCSVPLFGAVFFGRLLDLPQVLKLVDALGAISVPEDLHRAGLRGDAHQCLCGEQLLEL